MQETPCPLLQTAFPGRMAKLVLLHKTDSIYDDVPESVYDFPAPYLRAIREAVGDWAVYYEPVKAGPRGYFAVPFASALRWHRENVFGQTRADEPTPWG
jgi:putative restriction endonuclease